jgi:hypothetical protein
VRGAAELSRDEVRTLRLRSADAVVRTLCGALRVVAAVSVVVQDSKQHR